MVRYTKEHKQETRERIIATAGRRLKRDGIDGSGVATLMKDAGLTNGAFYAHFESKDDLVANVVADQLRGQCEGLRALAPGRAGVEQYVREYLSAGHRDNPGDGCPSAALLDEIGRCTDATRQAYTDGLLAVIDDVAARLAPHDPPSARAAHGHDHAAGPARHVAAAHVAQVAADQPGAGAQADQPRRPHPPLRRGLGVRKR